MKGGGHGVETLRGNCFCLPAAGRAYRKQSRHWAKQGIKSITLRLFHFGAVFLRIIRFYLKQSRRERAKHPIKQTCSPGELGSGLQYRQGCRPKFGFPFTPFGYPSPGRSITRDICFLGLPVTNQRHSDLVFTYGKKSKAARPWTQLEKRAWS